VSYPRRFLVEFTELPEHPMTEPPDERLEPVYRAVMPEGARPELVKEEFDLFRRMMDRLGRDRIPEDATPEETRALMKEAMSEDEELAAIAERFNEVIYSHEGSVIRKMMEYDERMGNWP
jgi:hypothetical protein